MFNVLVVFKRTRNNYYCKQHKHTTTLPANISSDQQLNLYQAHFRNGKSSRILWTMLDTYMICKWEIIKIKCHCIKGKIDAIYGMSCALYVNCEGETMKETVVFTTESLKKVYIHKLMDCDSNEKFVDNCSLFVLIWIVLQLNLDYPDPFGLDWLVWIIESG